MQKLILFIPSILFLLIVTPVYADDYQDGKDAWASKDYKMALEKLKPLADQGHAKAQFILGRLYEKGKGVPQDYKEAMKWYQKAAEGGFQNPSLRLQICIR